MTAKKIRTSRDPESWGLPEKIAAQNGYFEDEGIEVEFVDENLSQTLPEDLTKRPGTEDIKEHQLRNNDIDTYSVCEWGGIKRTHDFGEGKVIAKRTREGFTHRIYVRPDSAITTPEDLADTPIAVNHNAGSYFAAYEALENHLNSDQIETTHVGNASDRFNALRSGDVAAASLMEPYQTLADEVGYRGIIESPARGTRVAADNVPEEAIRDFVRAFNRAAAEINDHPEKYRELYLERLDLDQALLTDLNINLEELYDNIEIPEYDGYEIVEQDSLDETLQWMKQYELIEDDVDLNELITS